MSILPSLLKENNEDYYQRVDKVLDGYGIIPKRYLSLSKAINRLWNGTDPILLNTNHNGFLSPKDWQEIHKTPKAVPDMLDDLEHGNKYYTAVETDKGILLFGREIEGARQCNAYLQQNAVDCFFKPEYKDKILTVHELRGWPSLMEGKVNCCRDPFGEIYPKNEIPQKAYMDKSELKNVTETVKYDLAPTWENYYKLTNNETGLNLTNNVANYDQMTLLYIMDKGYPKEGLVEEYPDTFSYSDDFKEIEAELCGKTIYDSVDEIQEKAKSLAEKLLYEHFPDIRQKENMPEIKVAIAPKKNKGMRM